MRYLRCCKLNANKQPTTVPRYPNLQQVFITSRTYGGYATNPPAGASDPTAGCLSPEPYAFEEGFAVQKLIVAQINGGGDDGYSGDVHFNPNPTLGGAPWFDWGPYLWTSGTVGRSDGVIWCGGQTTPPTQCNSSYDVRYGDLADELHYWGDFTHPSANGQQKMANLLVQFIQGTLVAPQQRYISDWILPWIQH